MIRTRTNCFPLTEKDKYPFDEILMFFSEGGTTDDAEVLQRRLVPVSSLEAMLNRKFIYLHSIEFAGYDTSEKIIKSEAEAEKDFANEMIKNVMLSTSWQPNYCRPIVRINGINITSSISTFNNRRTAEGSLHSPYASAEFGASIGLPLPFCLTINKLIKEPREIEILGALAQKTADGYRNYPLLAIINFWHNFS